MQMIQWVKQLCKYVMEIQVPLLNTCLQVNRSLHQYFQLSHVDPTPLPFFFQMQSKETSRGLQYNTLLASRKHMCSWGNVVYPSPESTIELQSIFFFLSTNSAPAMQDTWMMPLSKMTQVASIFLFPFGTLEQIISAKPLRWSLYYGCTIACCP